MDKLDIVLPGGVTIRGEDCRVEEIENGRVRVTVSPETAFEALAEFFGKLAEGAAGGFKA